MNTCPFIHNYYRLLKSFQKKNGSVLILVWLNTAFENAEVNAAIPA
jgi:hypothetical protein